MAQAALDEVQHHMARRWYSHSGTKLGQVPVLQHRLGALWAVVQRTRQLVYYAASETDAAGANALAALCSAKAEVADAVNHCVSEAMTLCGGIAYSQNSVLSRLLRDARAAHVMAPTTDILRTWTGRVLLEEPLLSE